ncbi:rRNA pseudouridine synthase [Salibacteraceae bacterium]|jgi:23S rRNA pseudouridine2605 synthase|nr:rRNA pseudouridine synthase [Salibacteraceae bacterium]MDB4105081.1 rRNA pseudouridine synthase [Salibacteraceae bacterium]MDB9709170.1 rRNA pseudouridine synthase [Salibacteraceae bacterium]MDC1303898.1 rRNA pseudouridine synthase [Salibacteraceae bacterium]
MAKKTTWEKRAKKVQKEEFIVLGGTTSKKKEGVKRSTKPPTDKNTDNSEKSDRGPRTRATGDRKEGDSRGTRGGAKSFSSDRSDRSRSHDGPKPRTRGGKIGEDKFRKTSDSKPKFDPTQFITRDGDEGENDRFKNRGNADKQFRQNDRKSSYGKFTKDKPFSGFEKKKPTAQDEGLTRLNKYIAMAGICSRREADTFIENGLVSINGKVVTELGTKVKQGDVVEYAGEKIKTETQRYLLLNKPKDCITTVSDEKGRSTVIGLVKNACSERVFPVGRLDRNTTGLILLTNDGALADKLAHPSNEIRKVYHVITNKNVSIADLKKLETGVQLDDGIAKADAALFAGDGSVRNEIGLEIHSGRNRVVRRMFEAMGYEVTRLDRAAFAGLSKKGLPRGRWRFLTDKEVSYLRML